MFSAGEKPPNNFIMQKKKADKTKNPPDEKVESPSQKVIIITAALFVAVVAFLVFLPALQNEFLVWDDNILISENKNIQSLQWAFTDAISNPAILGWYPVTVVSLYVDNLFWGLDPFGYHLTNNIFHAINSFLVFILVFWLVRLGINNDRDEFRISLVSAFVTAVLFGIHPLRVESVAWITERKDLLYAFFYILSILSYIKYVSGPAQKIRYYWGSLLLFSMSLMSKSMAVTLPLVLLVIDYFPLRRFLSEDSGSDLKRIIVEKVPFFCLSLIVSVFTLFQHHEAGTLSIVETQPFIVRLLVSMRGYFFYLYKFIAPSGLVPWYPYPRNISPLSVEYAGSIILFLLFTAASIYLIKRKRLFPAAWFYYLIALLPIIGITQTAGFAAANRYTYLPCLGPFLIAGVISGNAFVKTTKKELRIVLFSLFIVVSGLLIGITQRQILIWRDSISLWSYQIDLFPEDESIVYSLRAAAYKRNGNLNEAVNDYSKAIELSPKWSNAYNNRAIVYEAMGRYEDAINDYNKAIVLEPKYLIALYNRGDLFEKTGKAENALADYTKAIGLDLGRASDVKTRARSLAYKKRAKLNEALGRNVRAIEDYTSYLDIETDAPDIYFSRGSLYLNMGEFDNAVKDFSRAIDLKPGFLEAYGNRGTSYMNLNNHSQAIEDFSMVINLAPQSDMAYMSRGIVYMDMGNPDLAEKDFVKASGLGNKEADKYLKEIRPESRK